MTDAYKALEGIERSFESGLWDEAEGGVKRLERLFPRIVQALGEDVPPDVYYEFGYSLGKLRSSFMSRDRSRITDHYIEVHDIILRMAARFAYEIPPALQFIDRYVEDAEKAAVSGSYKDVIAEMKEVGRYFRGLYDLLDEKGVKSADIWGYHQKINTVMAAAEAKSEKRVAVELQDLKRRTRGFIDLFLD